MVRQALGVSVLDYENFLHSYFVGWCEVIALKFSYRDRDLITNESLFNYYLNQWAILVENLLAEDIKAEYLYYYLEKTEGSDNFFFKIMAGYAKELDKYYPASLLPKTKTTISKKYQFNYN